ncbi:N-acetyltransferase domain-containing protein [Mycena sanguinolenta]|uniref:N-acetyltransferase domain-containing protein n=1 Tax=Mycena sanguinolenta TaxID=230812 RepID=A0A8H7D4F6_9AGAR|nr:N-acetyltransferase domain-containing protein [Mycena sanguinolenta]
MTSSQFFPLERNPTTGELFLRLSSPYENIILTPPRANDAAAIAAIVNDPAVHPWLGRPNATFSLEEAKTLVEEFKLASNSAIEALEDATRTAQVLVVTENCPVRSIRELQPDGTDMYIGNIAFKRCNWWEVQGSERDRLMAENNARPTGDPKIIWQVSDFLASSHHRRGIMTVVLATVLKEWAIPRMHMHHLHVSVFTGNNGSVRVFEKNGFVLVETLEDCIEIRGEKRSLHILDWKHVAE